MPSPSVVIIAYYFPPDGGAAVYRPLRFVRHLREVGWHPSVITRRGAAYDRYDPGLMALVPPDVDVVTVPDGDIWKAIQSKRASHFEKRIAAGVAASKLEATHQRPLRSFARRVVRRAEAWFYYPDTARGWIGRATRETVAVCRRKRPDVLLATGGPWSSFLVAHSVFKQVGVPYVLDFRDSWTLTCNEDFEMLRPRWAQLRDRRLLHMLFKDAQAVVFRYESEAECYWNAYPGALKRANIHVIPNGYEGDVEPFEAAPGTRCTILYAGTVGPYRYDTFLEALSLLRADYPADADRLRVLFVGEGTHEVGRAAASRGLIRIVETRDPVPSREVTRLQRDAHALFLLGVKPYQGYELCGSKVFSYLRAGRPILGILPDDETRKVLQRVGVSTLANIDSPRDIVQALRRVLDAWSTNTLRSLVPDPERCTVYAASNQTRALARALAGTWPVTPFIPGTVDMPGSLKAKIGVHGWTTTTQ